MSVGPAPVAPTAQKLEPKKADVKMLPVTPAAVDVRPPETEQPERAQPAQASAAPGDAVSLKQTATTSNDVRRKPKVIRPKAKGKAKASSSKDVVALKEVVAEEVDET